MTVFKVLIPARLDSSRLPEKALADIGGVPMVVRVAQQAQQSAAAQVWVATDHPRIQAACAAHGIDCVLTAANHDSGTARLAEAVTLLGWADDEIVVNVQGDEPLIPPALIQQVADTLAHSTAPMATAACPIHDAEEFANPNAVKVVGGAHGQALYFSRAPIPYPRDHATAAPLRHIGIYAYRAAFLREYVSLPESPLEHIEKLEQLRVLWHGRAIALTQVEHAPPAGVDTAEDLARVRAVFQP